MKERLIFKAIVGSQAYGTSIPTSDIDYKGVYVQSTDDLVTFKYKQQIEPSKDECYYELRRFVQLAMTANPTILEMLFVDDQFIVQSSPEFELLRKNRHKFLTKKCALSFGGFAVAQIQKAKGLNKKMNWDKAKTERKTVLDFCYMYVDNKTMPIPVWLKKMGYKQEFCGLTRIPHMKDNYNLWYDHVKAMDNDNQRFDHDLNFKGIVQSEDSNDVSFSEIPKGYPVCEGLMSFNKDEYSVHCKDYNQYQEWLKSRNTQRYVDVKGHDQKYDGKNLLHCRRLLDMAMEIAATNDLTVLRQNREYLLSIRRGEIPLYDIIAQAEKDITGLNELYAKSNLPDECSIKFANNLLLEVRNLKVVEPYIEGQSLPTAIIVDIDGTPV